MKISGSLGTGFTRSLAAWKGILIYWLFTLVLALTVVNPLKHSLEKSFGNSMITERLADGIDVIVLNELGPAGKALVASVSSGLLLIFLISFIANAFFSSGFFHWLISEDNKFSSAGFFRAGVAGFWPFLSILLIMTLLIVITLLIFILVPVIIISSSDNLSEPALSTVLTATAILFSMFLPVILLIADYARAWKVRNQAGSFGRAVGFGFRETFGKFRKSYLVMMIIFLMQLLWLLLAWEILSGWKPGSGAGAIVFLLISQAMFIVRLFLKVWRYGSVTALMGTVKDQADLNKSYIYEQDTDQIDPGRSGESPGQ